MKVYNKKIEAYKNLIQKQYVKETSIEKVITQCEALMSHSKDSQTSYFEFLYAQLRFIKKRWWILQACVLFLLWLLLKSYDNGEDMEKILGILATSFSVLIIPEIWKNRRFAAMEIEGAAFYSLRQICAARIVLFALADMTMVTIFFLIAMHTVQISMYELIINFLIPFNVSSCICFRLLCSKRFKMEYDAALISMVWIGIWLLIVSHDAIYHIIAEPTWMGLVLLSFIYLIFCIQKSQNQCEIIWEDNTNGIKA